MRLGVLRGKHLGGLGVSVVAGRDLVSIVWSSLVGIRWRSQNDRRVAWSDLVEIV